jgi:hypothetical protein
MFYLFQPLPGSNFVNAIFASNENSLVDIYVVDLYVYGW